MAMTLTRSQFFQLVAGGSAWLASSGFVQRIARAVPDVARPLPLHAVRLTGGPLKRAQDLDAAYLLSLDPDRMLAFYRVRAGLRPKAEGLTGWDADGRQLTGHIAGHHLSAVSLMWAATGDARFKSRADYLVSELGDVQDANGDGFAGALAGVKDVFAEVSKGRIRSANFDLNGLWSPWYTLHKTYAGLRDAYRYTGNQAALDVEVRFARWAEGFLAPMSDDLIQRMLATEFGGMNEVMADLYADTGDRRWLDLSYRFEHKAVLDPLKRGEDPLDGLHGNTQVPKLIGSAARYAYAGAADDLAAATTFWTRVVDHHTFATGGHGKDEYFREPDRLANITEGRTAETCNVYNMLKLTRQLFALQPDVRYAEFHERALFNHILGSIDSDDGATCYMVPVGGGVRREYADMQRSFTCCVGTGMESHGLHGLGIYYVSVLEGRRATPDEVEASGARDGLSGTGSRGAGAGNAPPDALWVNLYVPSTATWEEAGVRLAMDTGFPEGETATLGIDARASRRFVLRLRRPSWAGNGFAVRVNGQAVTGLPVSGSYVEIARTWSTGDTVTLHLPKTIRLERLPDNPKKAAIMWGPLVLAGDLGPAPRRRTDGDGDGTSAAPPEVPVLVTDRPLSEWIQPVADVPGAFRTSAARLPDAPSVPRDVALAPFYRVHRRSYVAYWDVLTAPDLAARQSEAAAERERIARLDRATLTLVTPGDPQVEPRFNQQGEESTIVRLDGRAGRRAAKWFSYDLPVSPAASALVVTYNSDNRRSRRFEILVDGRRLADVSMPKSSVSKFVDVEYPLPSEGRAATMTVRFSAEAGSETAPVFAVRLVGR
jgi:DUF1680 family protein